MHAGNEISGVISDGVRDSGLAMRDNQEEAPRPDRQEIQGSKDWVARGIGSDGCCITVLPDNGSAVTHLTVLLRVVVQEVTTVGENVRCPVPDREETENVGLHGVEQVRALTVRPRPLCVR